MEWAQANRKGQVMSGVRTLVHFLRHTLGWQRGHVVSTYDKQGTHWHYQPVYVDDPAGRVFSLCECHFNAADKLISWAEEPAMIPQGETADELSSDLVNMLADTYKWEPVEFSTLRVGMTFQRTGADVEGMIRAMNMARNSLG